MASELGRFAPSEILRYGSNVDCEVIEDAVFRRLSCCVSEGKQELFALESAESLLENHFHATLSQMGIAGMPAAVIASGALLQTLLTLQKNDLAHIRELQYYTTGRFMELDLDARRNLELTETMRSKEKRGTLLWVLDKTHTAMGGRMLRSWLEKPLLDPVEITRRHGAVEELTDNVIVRGELEEALRDVTDLERVQTRIVTGTVNCRDLLGLARGFRALPDVKAQLQKCDSPLLKKLEAAIDPLTDCADRIENTLVDDPPLTIREGGIIRKGASEEADRLRDIMEGGSGTIAAIEASEREKTGIRTLKVGFNRVFGYYIEVSKSFIDQVPANYIRKQTLANCERYITQELKELENVDRLYKEPSKEAGDVRFTVKDLSLENLLNAFAGILHKVELRKLDVNSPRQIKKETFSVKGKMLYIRDLLMEKDETYFFSLFEEDASANEVVVAFSALLELMKLQFIKTEQPDAFGDIKIVRNKENTGEIIIDYDESI